MPTPAESGPVNNLNGNLEATPQYPVSTLVQSVGQRPFKIRRQELPGVNLTVLTFPRGLTLIINGDDPNQPPSEGIAHLEVHRKFIPIYQKYLHWMTFTIPMVQNKVRAQIMPPNRFEAACEMVKWGAAACFINSNRPYRKGHSKKKRKGPSGR